MRKKLRNILQIQKIVLPLHREKMNNINVINYGYDL